MSKGIMADIFNMFNLGYTDEQITQITGYDLSWIVAIRKTYNTNKKAP